MIYYINFEDIVDVITAFLFSCIFLDILIIIVQEPSLFGYCFHIIYITNIVFLIKLIIL